MPLGCPAVPGDRGHQVRRHRIGSPAPPTAFPTRFRATISLDLWIVDPLALRRLCLLTQRHEEQAHMATVTSPTSAKNALPMPYGDIGYKIKCRRCGYVRERVARLSEWPLENRWCPTGCGAIVCISAYLLSQAFPAPSEQDLVDLALWQSKAERKEAAPVPNGPHRRVRGKMTGTRARS